MHIYTQYMLLFDSLSVDPIEIESNLKFRCDKSWSPDLEVVMLAKLTSWQVDKLTWDAFRMMGVLRYGLANVMKSGFYPLVNERNYGKSPCLIGKSTISMGHFQ